MKVAKQSLLKRLALAVLLSSALAIPSVMAVSPGVYHTVVFWLKPGTPQQKVDAIIESIKRLEALPMVEKVMVGTAVMSDRPVVDDSFSIAFTMIFKDEAGLSAYSVDPTHKKISSEMTMPYVDRGIIYDYKSR